MKNLIVTLTILINCMTITLSQDRNVMWIHGLGGGQASWLTNATHHHETYKMECKNPSYGLGTNVSTTTNSVKEKLKTLQEVTELLEKFNALFLNIKKIALRN